MNNFSELYKHYSNVALYTILQNPKDYQADAVLAATNEITSRHLTDNQIQEALEEVERLNKKDAEEKYTKDKRMEQVDKISRKLGDVVKDLTNLNRKISFELQLSEQVFLDQLHQFIDTGDNRQPDSDSTNEKKYKGVISGRTFYMKPVYSLQNLNVTRAAAEWTSISGAYIVSPNRILLTMNTKIRSSFQLILLLLFLVVFSLGAAVNNGIFFSIVTVLFVFTMYALYLREAEKTLEEDFINHFNKEIPLTT